MKQIKGIDKAIKLNDELFSKWFEQNCPAQELSSVIDAVCECHSCRYNVPGKKYEQRCSILNQRNNS